MTTHLKRTLDTSVRHADKLEVRLILTFLTAEMTQVLLDSLDECRASLTPTLMSSPAAVSYTVTVVCHYCTRLALASRGTGGCLQLFIDCLNLIPLSIVHMDADTAQQQPFMRVKGSCQCISRAPFCGGCTMNLLTTNADRLWGLGRSILIQPHMLHVGP